MNVVIRVYIFSTCLVDIASGPDGKMTLENPGKGEIDIFSISYMQLWCDILLIILNQVSVKSSYQQWVAFKVTELIVK